jgi:hypothetical protein
MISNFELLVLVPFETILGDAEAVLGASAKKVPFIRALLAKVSEPLCAACLVSSKREATR